MKLLVSDYDGTIKRFRHEPNIIQRIDLNQDLRHIKKFIEEGNIFNVSSQRPIISIKKELEKNKVPYNYVTAYGGLVTFDKDDKLIYAEYLDKKILRAIEELSKTTDLLQTIKTFDGNGNIEKELKDKLILIGLSVRNIRDTMDFFRSLNIDLTKYHFSYDNHGFYINNIINKNIGINLLLSQINEQLSEIITIGDSFHDLEMINEYNGWCIKNSELDIFGTEIIKRTPNIRTLIKTIK